MRVSSSPLPLAADAPDPAAGAPATAASAGEPFRTALHAASTAGPPAGAPDTQPAGAPADPVNPAAPAAPAAPGAHIEDTMAPAAAQVAYLARLSGPPERARSLSTPPPAGSLGALDPTQPTQPTRPARPARPTQPTQPTDTAPPGDSLDSALAALALGMHAAPVAPAPVESAGPSTASPSAPHDAAESDRKTTPPHLPEAALDPMTAATLRAAYGLHIATAPRPAPAAAATPAATPAGNSPVDAWTAAAIGRAISTLGGAAAIRPVPGAGSLRPGQVDAAAPAPPATAATAATATATGATPVTATDATDATAAAGATAAVPPTFTAALTPLEQAVHELVGKLDAIEAPRGRSARSAHDDETGPPAALPGLGIPAPDPARDPAAPAASTAPAPAAHAAPPTPPEPPANPSHVHLVIDDGPERVVATVALRGSEVHVQLRATDDATAAALARNAASLDHAMHDRGLQLGELTAERDRTPRDRQPPQDGPPRERRPRDAEKFELEDKP